MGEKTKKQPESLAVRIILWVLFGVISALLPLALVLGFFRIWEYPIEEISYTPDLLLVTFAIVCNTLGRSIDNRKKLWPWVQVTIDALSAICMLASLSAYFMIFGMSVENPNFEQYRNSLSGLVSVALVVSALHLVFGIIIEVIVWHEEKAQIESAEASE